MLVIKLTTGIALILTVLFVSGCATSAHRIDPYGTETITTLGGLDIQDATAAAVQLSESLLRAGVLGKGGKPSTLAIDRYINNTSVQLDRDYIVKQIRVTLNKAGVAQVMTSLGASGGIGGESTIASRAAAERIDDAKMDAFLNDAEPVKRLKPEFALTFKILDNRVSAGRVKQTTYIFQMSLTDVKTGLATWEDETKITKQGSKASVGWSYYLISLCYNIMEQ